MRDLELRCRVQRPEKWSGLGSVANKYRITKDTDRRKSLEDMEKGFQVIYEGFRVLEKSYYLSLDDADNSTIL